MTTKPAASQADHEVDVAHVGSGVDRADVQSAVDRALPQKVLLSIDPDVTAMTGLSRSKVYELIAAGELEAVKVGSRRFVLPASLDAFIDRLRVAS